MMISIVIGSVLVRGEFHFINIILLARFLGQRAQYKVTPANNKEDNITHHFLLGNLMVLDMCAHGPWAGNDGGRDMTKYFEGGGALYGGEIIRRATDMGQGDTRAPVIVTRPNDVSSDTGKLNFVNKSRP